MLSSYFCGRRREVALGDAKRERGRFAAWYYIVIYCSIPSLSFRHLRVHFVLLVFFVARDVIIFIPTRRKRAFAVSCSVFFDCQNFQGVRCSAAYLFFRIYRRQKSPLRPVPRAPRRRRRVLAALERRCDVGRLEQANSTRNRFL